MERRGGCGVIHTVTHTMGSAWFWFWFLTEVQNGENSHQRAVVLSGSFHSILQSEIRRWENLSAAWSSDWTILVLLEWSSALIGRSELQQLMAPQVLTNIWTQWWTPGWGESGPAPLLSHQLGSVRRSEADKQDMTSFPVGRSLVELGLRPAGDNQRRQSLEL